MGRFAADLPAGKKNVDALTGLSGRWIGRVNSRWMPKKLILDLDSPESPIHRQQEGSACNGHFRCARCPSLRMAEVAIPCRLSATILRRIGFVFA
jgi:hypothetical protein